MCTKITHKIYVTFYTFLSLTLMLYFDTIGYDEVILCHYATISYLICLNKKVYL